MGLTWPEPDKDMGNRRFARCTDLKRHAQHDRMHYLPPIMPSREVLCDTEEDFLVGDSDYTDQGHTRTMTDEEWAVALANYEKAQEQWHRSGGVAIVKAGPDIIDATFVLEDGGIAKGRWTGKGWAWLEWEGP